MGELPEVCWTQPSSATCQNAVIYYLDQARQQMGLGPYALPADFTSLPDDRQTFILSNLDRLAYELPPIAGLNHELSAEAMKGVETDSDPWPGSGFSGQIYAFASNWAGAYPSNLVAYFEWMYDDGYGSSNVDCNAPADSGCWGHRQNVFIGDPGSLRYSQGVASGRDRNGEQGYALLIVEGSEEPDPGYYYTWAEAEADGAGTNSYVVSTPEAHGLGRARLPETIIFAHPPKQISSQSRRVRITFRFTSTTRGSLFRCKLDRRHYHSCRSPKRYLVGPGLHTFRVQAISRIGADPTPAGFRFQVVR